MTIKGSTGQACAACKYQRRKCSPDCALAPYFPANQPKIFQNAHRLFGVCNIMKILKQLNDNDQKEEAMKSIIYEANMRNRFPVYGCWGIIWLLQHQLQQATEELQRVYAQLALCKERFPNNQLETGVYCLNNYDSMPIFQPGAAIELDCCPINQNNVANFFEANENVTKSLWVAQPFLDQGSDYVYDSLTAIQQQQSLVLHEFSSIQPETQAVQDYEDRPLNTIADDRQSYVESKDACCESSSESSLKDTTESMDYVSKSELRRAAACFSLTSVN